MSCARWKRVMPVCSRSKVGTVTPEATAAAAAAAAAAPVLRGRAGDGAAEDDREPLVEVGPSLGRQRVPLPGPGEGVRERAGPDRGLERPGQAWTPGL